MGHSGRENGTLCTDWRGNGPLQKGKGKTVLIGEGGGIADGKREHCVLIGEGVGHSRKEEGNCIDWRGSGP